MHITSQLNLKFCVEAGLCSLGWGVWCKPCCLDQIAQECFNTSLSVCLSTLPGSGILFFISELDIFTHHCFFLEMQLLYGKHESLYA